ncbi:MAG: N-acetylmuramoyl-L-alanine amidase [Bacillota bacterium]
MRKPLWHQAALVGLVVFFLGTGVRVAWLAGEPVRQVTAELQQNRDHLKDLVIVIDPGHGGFDPGAVVKGTREKELVLQIAMIAKDLLEPQGTKVIMTRTKDEDLGGTIREDLAKRVALVRQHNAQLYVSIHANKDSCNCWGAQSFYQRGGMPEGKALATAIQARLRQMTDTTRHALAADYFVLRTAPVPATVVEVGFLTNAREHAKLLEPSYQQQVATAIALGIADYRRQQARMAPAPTGQ